MTEVIRQSKGADARTPPIDVRRQLRKEVGFGCPVPSCGNPFLEWHHFDPPWREERHHRAEGMIALCGEHHGKADAGAFTVQQLRQLKAQALAQANEVSARFDWMRQDMVAVLGGGAFFRVPLLFAWDGNPVVWFTRDAQGHQLLNVEMLTTSTEGRFVMREHEWVLHGDAEDVECPPNGRLLSVKYPNGDALRIEFWTCSSPEELAATLRSPFPVMYARFFANGAITVCQLQLAVGGAPIRFGPYDSEIFGTRYAGNVVIGGGDPGKDIAVQAGPAMLR